MAVPGQHIRALPLLLFLLRLACTLLACPSAGLDMRRRLLGWLRGMLLLLPLLRPASTLGWWRRWQAIRPEVLLLPGWRRSLLLRLLLSRRRRGLLLLLNSRRGRPGLVLLPAKPARLLLLLVWLLLGVTCSLTA